MSSRIADDAGYARLRERLGPPPGRKSIPVTEMLASYSGCYTPFMIHANMTSFLAKARSLPAYIQQVKEAGDVDLAGYLGWLAKQDLRPTRSTEPDESSLLTVLRSLGSVNLVRDSNLLDKALLDVRYAIKIPIILYDSSSSLRRLVVLSDPRILSPADEEAGSSGSTDTTPSTAHDYVLAVRPMDDGGDGGAAAPPAGERMPPKYIINLGRVYVQDKRELAGIPEDERARYNIIEEGEYIPTDYAAVIDITSDERGVWVLHDRRNNSLEDEVLSTDPAAEIPLFTSGVTAGFRSAQVVRSLKDWNGEFPLGQEESMAQLAEGSRNDAVFDVKLAEKTEVERALSTEPRPPTVG
ncbi:hypothetical protein EsH8_V_001155 [Colletotrichum jinshuiense]